MTEAAAARVAAPAAVEPAVAEQSPGRALLTACPAGLFLTDHPSGLRVVTEPMADAVSVAIGFWVGIGARDEAGVELGASHFLEHLLFKGTATRSAQDIAEAIEAVGGEMNAFTARDHTAFYVRLLAKDIALGLDVLCDIMWNPAFAPAEVDNEREVILEEILMQGDDPEDLVHELAAAALWPGHPLGREVLGDAPTVRAMPVATIRSFHRRWYRPGSTVVAAAGRVDHDWLVDELGRRLSAAGVEAGGEVPVRAAPTAPARRVSTTTRRTEQAHLVIALPACDRHDPDRHALTVLAHVLGGGTSSRLFQEVRERRGLAYSVYAWRTGFDDAGMVGIYAGTAPGRAEKTARVLLDVLKALADGVSARELAVAKGNLIGSLALGLEDSGARMARIGRSLLVHDELPSVEEVVARLDAVDGQDLARVGERLLAAPRTLAVVGPLKEARVAAWAPV